MGILSLRRKDDVDIASCLGNLERLDAVAKSGLMDRSERSRLDALSSNAAERLGASMAFVSILDGTRLVLVGAHGLTGELAESRQTTPEASYCQYVVGFDDVLVVHDAHDDALVSEHPATHSGQVRSYLGVPLRHRDHCIGSFCVVDVEGRAWTDDDLAVLTELSMLAL